MKQVLLCPPDYFDIAYEINPWMDKRNKINRQKAHEEYQHLKKLYQKLGCDITEIPPENGLPDMVFAANIGFPKSNVFIKSNFKYAERKQEATLAKNYFQNTGYVIKELPETCIFEGQGDLLVAGDTYLMGWGRRSNKEAIKAIAAILDSEIIALKLNDPYFYHLDTCLMPLDGQTLALNPHSFEKEDLKKLYKRFSNIIEVGEEDNKKMACNGVLIEKTIVCGAGISRELKSEYLKYGYSVQEVEMTEFIKSGGSVKCLTLEFFP